jgi:translation initiation factor IF-1
MTDQNAHFKSFSGRTEVYDCVQELLDNAKSEVRIMTTENGIVRMYKVREKTYKDLIGRGVDLQIALPITKDNLLFVSHFIEMGAVIKHLPEVARNRFIITDKHQVLAHLTETDDRELQAEQDYGV